MRIAIVRLLLSATALLMSCQRAKEEPPRPVPATIATGPSAEQQGWLAHAWRHEKEGWTFLHAEGAPRARGFQHGYLLAKEIQESLRITRELWRYETSMDWGWLVEQSTTWLNGKIDTELLEEMGGIAEGMTAAGVTTTREEIVAYNAYIELSDNWWPQYKDSMDIPSPERPREACSSFIATGSMTADGQIVLGHNTMCSYIIADSYVILDLVPEHGHRILMQTSPGWIHSGTDFFITDAGLVGAETTISGFSGFTEWGIPEFVRMRRAMQDAGTIDEWCEIMKKGNNGGYANAWLLGDVNTREIARLELGLARVGFERTRDGFLTGSNIAENLKILRRETNVNDEDIRDYCVARRVRWRQLMAQHRGQIDATLAKTLLADHFDPYAKTQRPGGRTLCGHRELETEYSPNWGGVPFFHGGTIDAKVVDTAMAKRMSFAARWGSACGRAFDAKKYLQDHEQYYWLGGLLKDLPSELWVEFSAGERP